MQTASTPPLSLPHPPRVSDHLEVVIVYEDVGCAKRAEETLEQVLHNAGGQIDARKTMWRLDVLRSAPLCRMAGQDARRADMIIISAHGDSEVLPEMRSWLNNWGKSKAPCALVALIDHDPESFVAPEVLLNFLENVAREKGVDFFSQASDRNIDTSVLGD